MRAKQRIPLEGSVLSPINGGNTRKDLKDKRKTPAGFSDSEL